MRRIGTFFILIGAGLLLIFVASLQTGAGHGVGFLLAGLGGIVIGFFIFSRARKPLPASSGRFRMLRRRSEDHTEESDE